MGLGQNSSSSRGGKFILLPSSDCREMELREKKVGRNAGLTRASSFCANTGSEKEILKYVPPKNSFDLFFRMHFAGFRVKKQTT